MVTLSINGHAVENMIWRADWMETVNSVIWVG